jgi:hypothetical protein
MRLTSLAKPLGWFSLALGAAELLAPRRIASAHGVPKGKNVVRGFGAREVAAGAAVLARPHSSAPFLARAAGDVLDIGAAGFAARKARGRARTLAIGSLATVAGFLALDLLVARSMARSGAG